MRMTTRWLIVSLVSTLAGCATDDGTGGDEEKGDRTQQAGLRLPRLELDGPESVYVDERSGDIFVSNMVGDALDLTPDGKGYVLKISADRKTVTRIDGFNSPKGMRSYDGKLYVADVTQLRVVDLEKLSIESTIDVPGAVFLNDVAIGEGLTYEGHTVYVSDSFGNAVYEVAGARVRDILRSEQIAGVNGLLVQGADLVMTTVGVFPSATSEGRLGSLLSARIDGDDSLIGYALQIGRLDGLEADGPDHWIVTDFAGGKVLRVARRPGDAAPEVLAEGLATPADLAIDRRNGLLLVPSSSTNRIVEIKR